MPRFAARSVASPRRAWFVPGRIEILGKHTDYAGGRSLLCAVGAGSASPHRRGATASLRVADAGRRLQEEVTLDPGLHPCGVGLARVPRDRGVPAREEFPRALTGADVALASDLPRASGLSSSSALVVAIFTALAESNGLDARPEFAAHIRDRGRPRRVSRGARERPGIRQRSRASTASAPSAAARTRPPSSAAARASSRSTRSVRFAASARSASRRAGRFVVASSGVASDKTGAVRGALQPAVARGGSAILELWNRSARREDPNLFAAANVSHDAPERIRNLLRVIPVEGFSSDFLVGRFDQFLEESTVLIPGRRPAFPRGRRPDRRARRPLAGARRERRLGNQIPETVALASRGAGARRRGGLGLRRRFRGSVWALVRSKEADAFRKRWGEAYAEAFPNPTERSRFFTTRPGPPVVRL